ncbi:MAG: hypothetical protein D6769_03475, partial [Methanobacteriota archaeon]
MRKLLLLGLVLLFFSAGCLSAVSKASPASSSVSESGCCSNIVNGKCQSIEPDIGMKELLSSGFSLDSQSSPCWQDVAPTGENITYCNITIYNSSNTAQVKYYNNSLACGERTEFTCGEGCRVLACSQDLFKKLTREQPSPFSPGDVAEASDRNISLTSGSSSSLRLRVATSNAFSLLGTACNLFDVNKQTYSSLSNPKTRVPSLRVGITGGKDAYDAVSNYIPLSSEQCLINPVGYVDAFYLYNFKTPNRCRVLVYNGTDLMDFATAYNNNADSALNRNNSYFYRCDASDAKNNGKVFSRYIDCQLSCVPTNLDPNPGSIVYPSEDVCKYKSISGADLASKVLNYNSGIIKANSGTATYMVNSLSQHPDFSLIKGSFDNGAYRLGTLPFECTSDSECLSGQCSYDLHSRASLVSSQRVYDFSAVLQQSNSNTNVQAVVSDLAAFSDPVDGGCFPDNNGKLQCPGNVHNYNSIFLTKEEYNSQQPKIGCLKLVNEEINNDQVAPYFQFVFGKGSTTKLKYATDHGKGYANTGMSYVTNSKLGPITFITSIIVDAKKAYMQSSSSLPPKLYNVFTDTFNLFTKVRNRPTNRTRYELTVCN